VTGTPEYDDLVEDQEPGEVGPSPYAAEPETAAGPQDEVPGA
jgi:hypothetical protein